MPGCRKRQLLPITPLSVLGLTWCSKNMGMNLGTHVGIKQLIAGLICPMPSESASTKSSVMGVEASVT